MLLVVVYMRQVGQNGSATEDMAQCDSPPVSSLPAWKGTKACEIHWEFMYVCVERMWC